MDQELLDGIKKVVREVVREEISGVKEDVAALKSDVSTLKSDVDLLKTDVSELKSDVAEMKPQLAENTDLIKTLIARTDIHGAKLDQLNVKVAELVGSEKKQNELEDELYHHRHKIVIETGLPEFKAG